MTPTPTWRWPRRGWCSSIASPTSSGCNGPRRIVAAMGDRPPKTTEEVYAREQVILDERKATEIVVQALRIGDIAIASTPNETYALTGLKVKLQSPLPRTMVIELANGGDGYIPPPEQHRLGGYNTWPARSAGLEVDAEPRIAETALELLERVAGRHRRKYRAKSRPRRGRDPAGQARGLLAAGRIRRTPGGRLVRRSSRCLLRAGGGVLPRRTSLRCLLPRGRDEPGGPFRGRSPGVADCRPGRSLFGLPLVLERHARRRSRDRRLDVLARSRSRPRSPRRACRHRGDRRRPRQADLPPRRRQRRVQARRRPHRDPALDLEPRRPRPRRRPGPAAPERESPSRDRAGVTLPTSRPRSTSSSSAGGAINVANWEGRLDEIAVFDRALSAEELEGLAIR